MKFSKERTEFFSDGVMAIIITIMVLEIPMPKAFDFQSIMDLLNAVFTLFVSFFLVGSFWIRHCILVKRLSEINEKFVWRNLLFLFATSLFPISTKLIIKYADKFAPILCYIVVFIFVNFTYHFLFNGAPEANILRQGHNHSNLSLKHQIIIWFLWISVFLTILILAAFAPRVASYILIGLPILVTVPNFWISRRNYHEPLM